MVKSTSPPWGVQAWLVCMCILILMMVAVGGVTRLTESGLSMTDWKPILGAIPPRTEAQWQVRFEQYQDFPQFQQHRPDMSLTEFKGIFFWEYLHRLLGRLLGVAFVVPFLWFRVRGQLNRRLTNRLLVALVLGGGQGVLGWFMVKSGLADQPFVSPYRLAAHLLMAFLLFIYLQWLILDMRAGTDPRPRAGAALRWAAQAWAGILVIQIMYGAFTAGLDAGFAYNTWPKMNGFWMPPGLMTLEPAGGNLTQNPVTVQWIHRGLAYLLVLLVPVLVWRIRCSPVWGSVCRAGWALLAITLVQVALGIFTLLHHVPIALGVAHQLTACLTLGSCAWLIHGLEGRRP